MSDDCDCGSSLPCDGCDELGRALGSAAADNERLKAAFERMRSKLQERTRQHGVQLENAWALMEEQERLRDQLTEARRDIATLTKQRDDYIYQLCRVEDRLEWVNHNGGMAYILRGVGYGEVMKLMKGELEDE